MKSENLPLQEIQLTAGIDTVVRTSQGAYLKIPANAFSLDSGVAVKLLVQEAYTISQMVLSGNLRTIADGQPLSSGGMIYINAVSEETVTMREAITVAMPANYMRDSMQLYKGDRDANGNITWEDPQPLAPNPRTRMIASGEVLFQSKCSTCHAIGKNMTGPNIAHLTKRFGTNQIEGGYPLDYLMGHTWVRAEYPVTITRNAADTTATFYHDETLHWFDPVNEYRCEMVARFASVGPPFPDITREEITALITYIDNSSEMNKLPMPDHAYLWDAVDSCRLYYEATEKLAFLNAERERLIRQNNGMTQRIDVKEAPDQFVDPESEIDTTRLPDFDDLVDSQNNPAAYYQFTIETFGWFNIDILMENIEGVERSELFVRIQGEYAEKVDVFLIIPSVKVYVEGNYGSRDPKEFVFYKKDGTIYLPQNAKAYILAVSENNDGIAFAMNEFTTTLNQSFNVLLQASTKAEFEKAVSKIGEGSGMSITVNESLYAREIRKTDEEIKQLSERSGGLGSLRPKTIDCECSVRMK